MAVVVDNNVGREGGIKVLISAVVQENVGSPHGDRRNSDVLEREE